MSTQTKSATLSQDGVAAATDTPQDVSKRDDASTSADKNPDKSKDSRKRTGVQIYTRLLTYVKPYKWIFLAAVFGNICYSLVDASVTYLMKPILDKGFVLRDQAFISLLPAPERPTTATVCPA